MNVHQKFASRSANVAVLDKGVSRPGWHHLDLKRTLGGVSRSYGWPIGSLQGRIRLPGSALGGTPHWRANAPFGELRPVPLAIVPREPASNTSVQASKPAPRTRPRRPIPESDIILVGRRSQGKERERRAVTPEPLRAIPHPAPVPRVRSAGVRPWLAVVMALAMVGITFYCGTQWSRCHVITLPTTMNDKSVIG